MTFQFPDSRQILTSKLDGQLVGGFGPITVYWQRPADFSEHLPALQITQLPGQEQFIQRADRFRLSMYAEGTDALKALVAVFDSLVGTYHEAEGQPGMIDTVSSEATPSDVPYADARINQADAVIRAVVRAL